MIKPTISPSYFVNYRAVGQVTPPPLPEPQSLEDVSAYRAAERANREILERQTALSKPLRKLDEVIVEFDKTCNAVRSIDDGPQDLNKTKPGLVVSDTPNIPEEVSGSSGYIVGVTTHRHGPCELHYDPKQNFGIEAVASLKATKNSFNSMYEETEIFEYSARPDGFVIISEKNLSHASDGKHISNSRSEWQVGYPDDQHVLINGLLYERIAPK